MNTLDPAELARLLDSDTPPAVLDVRLADDHQAARIPGSLQNAVFETSFGERLAEALPDTTHPVVIYGSSRSSREAVMAAEKLERAGYTEVAVLPGGIAGWIAEGHGVESGEPLPEPPTLADGRHALDLDRCRVEWTGRNLLNRHAGTIGLLSGHLEFAGGALTGGEFEFDLQSLKCTDLAGSKLHAVLIAHLLDHDFLDAEAHPEARLVISEATMLPETTPGAPNLALLGDLTLRGVTLPVEFAAVSGVTPAGKAAAQAAFSIDRTRWGILYGSGKFFDRLAGHLVNDLIEFDIRIVTA